MKIHPGPRREFVSPGSGCSMGPLSNEFGKVRRRRTRAPEAHPPRGVRGHAPPEKFLKVRLLELLWSLFPLLDTIQQASHALGSYLALCNQKVSEVKFSYIFSAHKNVGKINKICSSFNF